MSRGRLMFAALFVLAASAAAGPAAAQAPRVVYLNFSDGTESLRLTAIDDAPSNGSTVVMTAAYPAFTWPAVTTGAVTRQELVARIGQRVHEVFLPYNVLVTLTRPAAGPYTMVMIGGRPGDVGVPLDVAGLAFLDCTDSQPSNVVFAFSEVVRGSEQGLVSTIAQEAAHAYGLEHTAEARDLMHPQVDPRQMRFLDEEMPLIGDRSCGPTTQNSHRRLLDAVGPWAGAAKPFDDGRRTDLTPPALVLFVPAPAGRGQPLAQPVWVRAEVSDPSGVDHVVLMAGSERSVRHRPPFQWSLAGFPPGPLTLSLTAVDRQGNFQTLEQQLLLGADPGPPGGCGLAPGRAAPSSRGGHGPPPGLPLAPLGLGVSLLLLTALRRLRRSLINPCSDVQPPGQPSV